MKKFRTLELAMDFYKNCQKLKISPYSLKNQFERASLSVVLNISEGAGRYRSGDRRQFYSISIGSLKETQTMLMIMDKDDLVKKSNILAAHLYKLIQNPGGS